MNSINEIKKFMNENGIRDGIEKQVVAYVDGEKFDATVQFVYEFGYMQYRMNIVWEFDDFIMKEKGLHGTYNTNYQEFEYVSGVLSFYSDKHKIEIRG